MSYDNERYELTTSLSIVNGQREPLEDYVQRLDGAVARELATAPLVTAYFVALNDDASEITIGLRFEGMNPAHIEDAATHILDESMLAAGTMTVGSAPVREESTLVPA